jgi:ribose transport system substrate-binding protein
MVPARKMVGAIAGVVMLVSACSSGASPSPAASAAPSVAPSAAASAAPSAAASAAPSAAASAAAACNADANLTAAEAAGVLSKGPHGENPSEASSVTLTPDELTKVKAMSATAAIVMHYGGDDWSAAQIAGLTQRFGELNIKIVATTDANFVPATQVSQIETVLAKKPSIIVSIPTDPVATKDAYKKAAAQGVKLVFMDNVPNDMVAGKDYISVVSADNRGNGVVSAHLAAKAMNCEGTIGLIFHEADFFVTRDRYEGFKTTIQDKYPNIKIVDEKGVTGSDFAGQSQAAANAMLTKTPDLKAIWAVWDVPSEGVIAAARASNRMDLIIATEDLGKNVAIQLAKDELIKGLGAQRPFDQGVTEANLAAYGLLGKTAPVFVALPALAVSHANVLQAWKDVYHVDAPAEVKDSYKQ